MPHKDTIIWWEETEVMNTPNTGTEEWELGMRDTFLDCAGMPGKHLAWSDYMLPAIREAFATQKAQLIAEVESKLKDEKVTEDFDSSWHRENAKGYNEGIEDALKILTKIKSV